VKTAGFDELLPELGNSSRYLTEVSKGLFSFWRPTFSKFFVTKEYITSFNSAAPCGVAETAGHAERITARHALYNHSSVPGKTSELQDFTTVVRSPALMCDRFAGARGLWPARTSSCPACNSV